MKTTYKSKIAPSEYDDGIIPVNVNISVTVIDVLSILEKDLQFILKFRLFMNWYDYRLSYHNLKTSKLLNSLSRDEVEKIWIPFIIFSNTENSEFTEGNKESEVSIIREGDFTESTLDITEERNIFVGKENRISFRQMYSKQFRCLFQLQLYPFDTQVQVDRCFSQNNLSSKYKTCSMDLSLRDIEMTTINLTPDQVTMQGDTVLVQYIVQSVELEKYEG